MKGCDLQDTGLFWVDLVVGIVVSDLLTIFEPCDEWNWTVRREREYLHGATTKQHNYIRSLFILKKVLMRSGYNFQRTEVKSVFVLVELIDFKYKNNLNLTSMVEL